MTSPTGPNITCYGYNYLSDNQFFTDNAKCPNSGSCCGADATCLSNRLCKKADGVLVRPSCVHSPWSLDTCAQICLYDNTDGYVPRVNVCPDGSYCCDNDPTCCASKSGAILNSNGVLIGFANQTSLSTSSMSSTASISTSTMSISSSLTSSVSQSTTSASASSSSVSPSATSSGNAGLSTGAEAGIGVGVSLAVLAVAAVGLAVFFVRRRRARQLGGAASSQHELYAPSEYTYKSPDVQSAYPVYKKVALEPEPTELDSGHIGELE